MNATYEFRVCVCVYVRARETQRSTSHHRRGDGFRFVICSFLLYIYIFCSLLRLVRAHFRYIWFVNEMRIISIVENECWHWRECFGVFIVFAGRFSVDFFYSKWPHLAFCMRVSTTKCIFVRIEYQNHAHYPSKRPRKLLKTPKIMGPQKCPVFCVAFCWYDPHSAGEQKSFEACTKTIAIN